MFDLLDENLLLVSLPVLFWMLLNFRNNTAISSPSRKVESEGSFLI